jgi:hypothetical protein
LTGRPGNGAPGSFDKLRAGRAKEKRRQAAALQKWAQYGMVVDFIFVVLRAV